MDAYKNTCQTESEASTRRQRIRAHTSKGFGTNPSGVNEELPRVARRQKLLLLFVVPCADRLHVRVQPPNGGDRREAPLEHLKQHISLEVINDRQNLLIAY